MNGGNDYKGISLNDSIGKKFIMREIYAISTGDSLFLNCLELKLQKWYTYAVRTEDFLLFRAGIPMNSDVVNTNAMLFGPIGGGISGAIAAMKRYDYSLDLKTGRIELLDGNE